ncbi:MAG: RNA polymerase sigma factor [Gemmatimonadetes bacterium]|nr:RNA polymerase sigma factor [Gemmatimonadota bacterium]MYG17104.1 RNA polymerase sigma factor [Gemmatimonadota bacterium]MYH18889.1 RNA polymerase sigma factor [Gemmatimonadota bacterium]MYK97655.1 RNA polymerase sigma factor [Gemmatimonadota bacterium]
MTQDEGRCIALEIHRGNRDAVGDLVAAYQDRLFTYAFHMLGGSDDALDVTQEAFVKAFTTLTGKYDAERCRTLEVRPWLYRIVRNLALNRLRSRKRRDDALVSMKENLPAQVFDTGNDLARTSAIRAALTELGRESRELIILRYIEQYTYAEIATVTGSSESALRSKVYRALRKLRKIMEDGPSGH